MIFYFQKNFTLKNYYSERCQKIKSNNFLYCLYITNEFDFIDAFTNKNKIAEWLDNR